MIPRLPLRPWSSIIACFMALCATLVPLAAQNGKEPSPRVFHAILTEGTPPELFYQHQGKPVSLHLRAGALSRPHPAPPGGIVALYRIVPAEDPATPPLRVPVAEINLGPVAAPLVLLSASGQPDSPRIAALVVDHSLDAHPSRSVRVFNLCRGKIALQAGSELAELSPAQNRIIPYPDIAEAYLPAKAALWTDGAWHVRLTNRIRIIHGLEQNARTRAIWLLTSPPPTSDDPAPRITVRNIIDFLPAQETRVTSAR